MRNSVRSGMAGDSKYIPTLWCYKDLEFLVHANDEKKGTSNIAQVHSETQDVEIAEEAVDEPPVNPTTKKSKLEKTIEKLHQTATNSFDLVSEYIKEREKIPKTFTKTKEDLFCEFLSLELRQLKFEETFEELKVDILKLVNTAKRNEKQRNEYEESFVHGRDIPSTSTDISSRYSEGSWRMRHSSTSSSTLASINSSPIEYAAFAGNINKNDGKKIIIQDVKIFKPPNVDGMGQSTGNITPDNSSNKSILELAAIDLFLEDENFN